MKRFKAYLKIKYKLKKRRLKKKIKAFLFQHLLTPMRKYAQTAINDPTLLQFHDFRRFRLILQKLLKYRLSKKRNRLRPIKFGTDWSSYLACGLFGLEFSKELIQKLSPLTINRRLKFLLKKTGVWISPYPFDRRLGIDRRIIFNNLIRKVIHTSLGEKGTVIQCSTRPNRITCTRKKIQLSYKLYANKLQTKKFTNGRSLTPRVFGKGKQAPPTPSARIQKPNVFISDKKNLINSTTTVRASSMSFSTKAYTGDKLTITNSQSQKYFFKNTKFKQRNTQKEHFNIKTGPSLNRRWKPKTKLETLKLNLKLLSIEKLKFVNRYQLLTSTRQYKRSKQLGYNLVKNRYQSLKKTRFLIKKVKQLRALNSYIKLRSSINTYALTFNGLRKPSKLNNNGYPLFFQSAGHKSYPALIFSIRNNPRFLFKDKYYKNVQNFNKKNTKSTITLSNGGYNLANYYTFKKIFTQWRIKPLKFLQLSYKDSRQKWWHRSIKNTRRLIFTPPYKLIAVKQFPFSINWALSNIILRGYSRRTQLRFTCFRTRVFLKVRKLRRRFAEAPQRRYCLYRPTWIASLYPASRTLIQRFLNLSRRKNLRSATPFFLTKWGTKFERTGYTRLHIYNDRHKVRKVEKEDRNYRFKLRLSISDSLNLKRNSNNVGVGGAALAFNLNPRAVFCKVSKFQYPIRLKIIKKYKDTCYKRRVRGWDYKKWIKDLNDELFQPNNKFAKFLFSKTNFNFLHKRSHENDTSISKFKRLSSNLYPLNKYLNDKTNLNKLLIHSQAAKIIIPNTKFRFKSEMRKGFFKRLIQQARCIRSKLNSSSLGIPGSTSNLDNDEFFVNEFFGTSPDKLLANNNFNSLPPLLKKNLRYWKRKAFRFYTTKNIRPSACNYNKVQFVPQPWLGFSN